METAAKVTAGVESMTLADRFKRVVGEKVSAERRMLAARLALDLGARATAGPESAQRLADELHAVALSLLEG